MRIYKYLRKIVTLTSILILVFSAANISFAATPDIPEEVYEYFTDTKYNYQEFDSEENINERCWVYKVYFQMNKDGSGYIDVYYVKEITDNNKRTVVQHLMFEPTAKSYNTGHFDAYEDYAPWIIFSCEVHKDDGLTVIENNTGYEETSNPKPTPSPIPTPSPTPTIEPTASIEPTATITINVTTSVVPTAEITGTENIENNITPSPSEEPTIEVITPTPTVVSTPVITQTQEPSFTVISEDIKNNQEDRGALAGVFMILLLILMAAFILVVVKYQKSKRRNY